MANQRASLRHPTLESSVLGEVSRALSTLSNAIVRAITESPCPDYDAWDDYAHRVLGIQELLWQENSEAPIKTPAFLRLYGIQSAFAALCHCWALLSLDNRPLNKSDLLARDVVGKIRLSPAHFFFQSSWDLAVDSAGFVDSAYDAFQSIWLGTRRTGIAQILSDVYQAALPPEIRRHLGEFHTPSFLASHVLRLMDYPESGKSASLIDPSSGCGVFLESAIAMMPEGQLAVEGVLTSIVGLEVNPAALAGSWCTYVFAIRKSVQDTKAQLRIPVFLVDLFSLSHVVSRRFADDPLFVPDSVPEQPDLFSADRAATATGSLGNVEAGSSPAPTTSAARRVEATLQKELASVASMPLFTYVVGNPAWINWADLEPEHRPELQRLIKHYRLEATTASVGAVKLDISALSLVFAVDKLLAHGGRLGYLIPQAVLKARAMAGLRRFRLPDGTPYGPIGAHDFSAVQMFNGAQNRTALLVVEKGKRLTFPVRTLRWQRGVGVSEPRDSRVERLSAPIRMRFSRHLAFPLGRDSSDPWVDLPDELGDLATYFLGGENKYRPREGVNVGGASSIYWGRVDEEQGNVVFSNDAKAGRTEASKFSRLPIERELLYPLLRGRDLNPWHADPKDSVILVPHTAGGGMHAIPEAVLQSKYPSAYSFLLLPEVRARLSARRALLRWGGGGGHTWYSLFEIGPYTFATHKVAYRGEVATSFVSAVISTYNNPVLGERLIMPDQTVHFIPCSDLDEAHFLSGILNSTFVHVLYKSFNYKHPSMFFVQALNLPQFDPTNATHKRVSTVARDIAAIAQNESINIVPPSNVQESLDSAVASAYAIPSMLFTRTVSYRSP